MIIKKNRNLSEVNIPDEVINEFVERGGNVFLGNGSINDIRELPDFNTICGKVVSASIKEDSVDWEIASVPTWAGSLVKDIVNNAGLFEVTYSGIGDRDDNGVFQIKRITSLSIILQPSHKGGKQL